MLTGKSSFGVVLERFELYSTKAHYYLVGHDKAATAFKLLKLSRLEAELEATEDPCTYTKDECTALLRRVRDGNARIGGLQFVCKAAGLIGCFKFLEGFYLLLVTQRRYHGTVCGQKVYGIDKTLLVPLVQPSVDIVQGQGRETAAEKRYRKLLLSGLELNKDFYFSYTYNLARTLQANLTAAAPADPFDSMFVWNEYLSRPLREALHSSSWLTPLIHGFWQQRSLALFGRTLTVTLIARRSKHFAGTRYRKRGVNFKGQVANDVEAEQLVDAGIDRRTGMPELASIVQVRGSIPLYWNQEGVTHLKPDITLQHYDPLYSATRLHFEDISARYGHPVVVLNLVKSAEKRPRETILRKEFAIAIAYINQQKTEQQRISYIPWDFNYHAKQRGTLILADMAAVIQTGLQATSFFAMSHHEDDAKLQGQKVQLQHGVLRTNCIDCLDRTNVAQFAYGLTALGQQLHALGLADAPTIDAQSSAARQLMDMYEAMGNVLSRQYGGSEAHSTFFQRQRGDWEAATQSRDLMTSIRRFYSNAYTDAEKQDAINLFLGNFVPQHGHAALWELDSDYFLHAGQRFSKPPYAPSTPRAAPPASLPSSSLSSSAAVPITARTDCTTEPQFTHSVGHSNSLSQASLAQSTQSLSQSVSLDDQAANSMLSDHRPPGSEQTEAILLPQLQNVDLHNVEQAGSSPYSPETSAQSSSQLRAQVQETVTDIWTAASHSQTSAHPASTPTAAAIAVEAPAGTSPQAFQTLVQADATSLGPIRSATADERPVTSHQKADTVLVGSVSRSSTAALSSDISQQQVDAEEPTDSTPSADHTSDSNCQKPDDAVSIPHPSGSDASDSHQAERREQSTTEASTSAAGAAMPLDTAQLPVKEIAGSSAAADPSISRLEPPQDMVQGSNDRSNGQLPTNLSMLQSARQSEANRYQKKPKLESFDKIIGRPPNTPHHVTLQAAPTHKAYFPQWLASPLGITPSQNPRNPPLLGTGSRQTPNNVASASRFTTEDAEVHRAVASPRSIHRDTSHRVLSPEQQHQYRRAKLHQADPNEPYTPPQPLRAPPPGPSTNPFATASQAAFSPDRHKVPTRLMSRAASETSICKPSTSERGTTAMTQTLSSPKMDADSTEGSFLSLPLQTVRPTAPKPYQAGAGQYARPGSALSPRPYQAGAGHLGRPGSALSKGGLGSGGMQRARSLDTHPTPSSSSSGGPSPGVASPPMRYPSFAADRVSPGGRQGSGMARAGSLTRHTLSKHSPQRRITFPSLMPLFSSPSHPKSPPLEPVQEGEQLASAPRKQALPRRQSTTALDRRVVLRGQSASKSLDLTRAKSEEPGLNSLGMSPELAAWWGEKGTQGGGQADIGADPLQGWVGREQQARAVYKSFLSASQSPLDPFEQWALEDKYASLCNFVVHISMDGFSQGAASKWRHTEGLRGSITCAEELLQDLASQCRTETV